MKYSYLLVLVVGILLSSCQQSKEKKCKYGKPKAIFSQTLPGVALHEFSEFNQEAVERVVFKDSLEFTLTQSGCDHVRQVFEMTMLGNYQNQPPIFWVQESLQLLQRLSSMGPAFQSFSVWAQSIEMAKEGIKLSESTQVQAGFFVKIDRVLSDQNATLVLTLSDEP